MKLLFCMLTVCLVFGLQQCNNRAETMVLEIKPYKSSCIGVGAMACFITKSSGDWELWYDDIKGFNYQWGYSYQLEIKAEPVKKPWQDESSVKYSLLKILKKEKTDRAFEFELLLKDKYGLYVQSLGNDTYNFLEEVDLKDSTAKLKHLVENEGETITAICKFKIDNIEIIDIK